MFNLVQIPTIFWRVGKVESAASTNKPRMWIEESVQKRTDARYGFFYNAGLNH
jgi:hypothetical protein